MLEGIRFSHLTENEEGDMKKVYNVFENGSLVRTEEEPFNVGGGSTVSTNAITTTGALEQASQLVSSGYLMLYVDADNGDDSADGLTSTSPLRTIEKAVQMYKALCSKLVGLFIRARGRFTGNKMFVNLGNIKIEAYGENVQMSAPDYKSPQYTSGYTYNKALCIDNLRISGCGDIYLTKVCANTYISSCNTVTLQECTNIPVYNETVPSKEQNGTTSSKRQGLFSDGNDSITTYSCCFVSNDYNRLASHSTKTSNSIFILEVVDLGNLGDNKTALEIFDDATIQSTLLINKVKTDVDAVVGLNQGNVRFYFSGIESACNTAKPLEADACAVMISSNSCVYGTTLSTISSYNGSAVSGTLVQKTTETYL